MFLCSYGDMFITYKILVGIFLMAWSNGKFLQPKVTGYRFNFRVATFESENQPLKNWGKVGALWTENDQVLTLANPRC